MSPRRRASPPLRGDAGGPVLDPTGAVIGMLLPPVSPDGKTLPSGVHFALSAAEIARLVEPAGVVPAPSDRAGALPPADLGALGTGMTVLVSCWD